MRKVSISMNDVADKEEEEEAVKTVYLINGNTVVLVNTRRMLLNDRSIRTRIYIRSIRLK